jgi:hypothetical protein
MGLLILAGRKIFGAARFELENKGEDWLTDVLNQHPLPLLELRTTSQRLQGDTM